MSSGEKIPVDGHARIRYDDSVRRMYRISAVHGALAQLGARHNGIVEVTGLSPVCSRPPETFENQGFPAIFMV